MKGFLALAAIAFLSGNALAQPADKAAAGAHVRVETSMGEFVIELDPAAAPKTVENFLQYAKDGHYYRTIFHRVVPGFVVQGGGYSRYLNERPTRDPVSYEGDNGLKNVRGSVAMARTLDPDSATSQWYVNLRDNPKLDHLENDLGVRPGYTVFGRVVEGMGVVDAIAAVETGPGGPFESEVPVEPVILEDVVILDASASE
ncbi:MAG: peptidyl-prolyl cis-trans isomerase [Alphaproteobacteria bacterium]|nr:peptidyl-prolyl cis-trans isomerase [Alphaproteobacteria bacterium]